MRRIKNGQDDKQCCAQACSRHSFLCAIIQAIELLRQSISYLALRKEKSMLLHYPYNSSPANNSERLLRADRQNKNPKIEHEVQQHTSVTVLRSVMHKSSHLRTGEPVLNWYWFLTDQYQNIDKLLDKLCC